MRIITDIEFNELALIHPWCNFMGGSSDGDDSKSILIVRDKIYLLDEDDDPSQLLIEQQKEAKEFVDNYTRK